MEEKTVVKPIDELNPGDILKQDIGTYKELQAGTVLDKGRIALLEKLGVRRVIILGGENDLRLSQAKTQAIEREISERIDQIGRNRKWDLKKESEADLDSMGEDKADIIRHIKQSSEDIVTIEGGDRVSLKRINDTMDRSIRDLERTLKVILVSKQVDIRELENIVNEFILITGPKRDSSLLLLGIIRKGANIIIKHAVNTCLLSLAVAIEMTKIMAAQLKRPEVLGDMKKLKICNTKIFNKEELIKLGVAAILHDIGLVDVFPDITEDTQLTKKDQSKLILHPSRAFSYLSARHLDYDIRKAVLQHHEKIDGSGYPDAIEKRHFTKYSLVLSFSNYYDLKTTKNPFEHKLHPQKALMDIIQNERASFDDDVLFAFCKAASFYPIGSWVSLSDDSIGLVIKASKNDLKRPVLKVVYSPDFKELLAPKVLDLSTGDLKIKDIIDVESIEIFDPRYERFIFDEREFERCPVQAPAHVSVIETSVQVNGLVENISAAGVQMRSSFNISKGERVEMGFPFKGRNLKKIVGLVVWKKEIDPKTFSYGVKFFDLPADIHEFLYSSIFEELHGTIA